MKLKEILKKKKIYKKENFTINVGLFWNIILAVAFVLVVSSFVFGFFLFKKVDESSSDSTSNKKDNSIEMVTKERINRDLQYFVDREKRSTNILNSLSPVVDPSL